MVFGYNDERNSYNILEIIHRYRWIRYLPVHMNAVRIVVPRSYGEISNLRAILNPIAAELENYRYVYICNTCIYNMSFTIIKCIFNRYQFVDTKNRLIVQNIYFNLKKKWNDL